MTSNARIALALQACEGLTDAELIKRGPQGFAKMIERKRVYSKVAHTLSGAIDAAHKAIKQQHSKIAVLESQLNDAKAMLATLEQMDAPVEDTTQAAGLLAAITSKKDAS